MTQKPHFQRKQKREFFGYGGYGVVATSVVLPLAKEVGEMKMESLVSSDSFSIASSSATGGALASAVTTAAAPFEIGFQIPDLRLAIGGFMRTREAAEFLSGALAGAMTKALLAPLETIRTRMIVGVGLKNISGSFLEVVEQQGWQGLWAGNGINMLRIVPTQAIELGTFECVKRAMTTVREKWETEPPKLQIGPVCLNLSLAWISPVAVAGAAAGIFSTLACHPLEVLKDRLTVSPDIYPSLGIAIRNIYRDGGLGAFYAGLQPTLVGMLPYSTCFYFMYDSMKVSYCKAKNKKSLSRPETLLLGALAGLTAGTISFPLEVARKRLMVGALQGKCPPNMAAALSEVIRERGFIGLYRGWGASCLKVMPSSGITWIFYEAWKDVLLPEKPQKSSRRELESGNVKDIQLRKQRQDELAS